MSADHNLQYLIESLEQALKSWHRQEAPISLTDALPHLAHRTRITGSANSVVTSRLLSNQLLLDLLEALATTDGEAATLLRRRYIDDQTGFAVANSLGMSESGFYRRRREALHALAELGFNQGETARATHVAELEGRLEPPSYQQLFGVTDIQNRLLRLLHDRSAIKLICLSGIGGLGKTALADSLARATIAKGAFVDLAWISARQQLFTGWGDVQTIDQPALTIDSFLLQLDRQLSNSSAPPRPTNECLASLKHRLAQGPQLIILDNLETAADAETLFPVLRELSQSAWILVTSRFGAYDQPDVHILNLDELDEVSIEALVRDEASRRGLNDLAQAPQEIIAQIYQITGGNPLAVKLVIGQVQMRTLSTVLADLSEARGRKVDTLYEYIYRQSWNLLDDPARHVLLAMPLVATPGATLDHLAGVTELTQDDLYEALDLLIRLSLVTVGGSFNERRYQIHRLTETFLHKQVTKWI